MANLSLSLKERQKFSEVNCAAATISKMTSRSCQDFAFHWEMLNCFKGSSLFFHTASNTQFSAYLSNKYWSGWLSCLEGRELKTFFSILQRYDSFPQMASRVSLFNVNVLNHNDKLSLKTVIQIKFRRYSR